MRQGEKTETSFTGPSPNPTPLAPPHPPHSLSGKEDSDSVVGSPAYRMAGPASDENARTLMTRAAYVTKYNKSVLDISASSPPQSSHIDITARKEVAR